MKVAPVPMGEARKWCSETHRHLRRPVTGWLFGVQVLDHSGKRIGIAMAGRPKARALQDGLTCEITRVAIAEGHPNACSFAYGALRRADVALGYTRIYTYTRADEPGASTREAGFVFDGVVDGREWSTPSRVRDAVEDSTDKHRWVWLAEERRLASNQGPASPAEQ